MIEHPQVIHFPIALFSTAIITEILSYIWKKSFFSSMTIFLLVLGCFFSLFATQTGEAAAEVYKSVEALKPHIRLHKNAGEWMLKIFTFVLVAKIIIKYFKVENLPTRLFITLLMLIGSFQIYQTGLFGGKLVYDKGVGVKPMQEKLLQSPD